MKKIIITGILAVSILSACGDNKENDAEQEKAKVEEKKVTLDDMCECATEMLTLGTEMTMSGEDNAEATAKFEAKGKECEEIGEKLEEGKDEAEIKAMKEEFMETCAALKDF